MLHIFSKMYHFFQDIFICGQRNLHDICLVIKEMSVYFDLSFSFFFLTFYSNFFSLFNFIFFLNFTILY